VKNKLFFLLVLPLVWFVVALISHQPGADRIYLLAVAPSAWLFFWEGSLTVTTHLVQLVGLPVMFLVGFVLYKFKMKPRVTMISLVVITFILWIALLVSVSQSYAIKVPGAIFVWFLCCFNFSLCLLPFLAAPVKLAMFVIRKCSKNNP
jgi:peptidoglycan/LPS O-acetylase OafA/YrhL